MQTAIVVPAPARDTSRDHNLRKYIWQTIRSLDLTHISGYSLLIGRVDTGPYAPILVIRQDGADRASGRQFGGRFLAMRNLDPRVGAPRKEVIQLCNLLR